MRLLPSPTGLSCGSLQAPPRSPGSRAWSFQTCVGSTTTQDRPGTRDCAPVRIAFRFDDSVGIPIAIFRSSIPSPSIPLFTLRRTLHSARRKTRGRVVRYSFLVRLLHPLLHAGLSRRTVNYFSETSPGPHSRSCPQLLRRNGPRSFSWHYDAARSVRHLSEATSVCPGYQLSLDEIIVLVYSEYYTCSY